MAHASVTAKDRRRGSKNGLFPAVIVMEGLLLKHSMQEALQVELEQLTEANREHIQQSEELQEHYDNQQKRLKVYCPSSVSQLLLISSS
jgi:hypothetical protein